MNKRLNSGRMTAATALIAVEDGAHVQEALANAVGVDSERSLAWFIALGVLRHRGTIDAALREHLRKPLNSLDVEVRVVLRIGTFEKLFARTPNHAAVDQSVRLIKALKMHRAGSFVNAILRRVSEPGKLTTAESLEHPAWIVERWTQRFGEEATSNWCRANNEPSRITLVARDDDAFEFISREITGQPGRAGGETIPRTWTLTGSIGRVEELSGFEQGLFWVADPASVRVADLLPSGGLVLDATAAPGGKTFRAISNGSEVTSVDLSANRLERLHESSQRLGLKPDVVVHDWLDESCPFSEESFDAVLIDAPCSALGTLGRHPDVRWRRTPLELPALAEKQLEILKSVAPLVKVGGTLIYSVCSAEPEEGEQVVSRFCGGDTRFEQQLSTCAVPPEEGEDGFFAAQIVRQ